MAEISFLSLLDSPPTWFGIQQAEGFGLFFTTIDRTKGSNSTHA